MHERKIMPMYPGICRSNWPRVPRGYEKLVVSHSEDNVPRKSYDREVLGPTDGRQATPQYPRSMY